MHIRDGKGERVALKGVKFVESAGDLEQSVNEVVHYNERGVCEPKQALATQVKSRGKSQYSITVYRGGMYHNKPFNPFKDIGNGHEKSIVQVKQNAFDAYVNFLHAGYSQSSYYERAVDEYGR
jgi:hypothetical protein